MTSIANHSGCGVTSGPEVIEYARHSHAAIVLLLAAACEKTQPPPAPLTPGDAGPIDATVIVPVPPPLPPSLVAAPRWVMRQLYVGSVAMPPWGQTFTLRRDRGRAILEIAAQQPITTGLGFEVVGWNAATTTAYLGTTTEGDSITIEVRHGSTTLRMDCQAAKQSVGPANARRRPGPRAHPESCGDEGRWFPATSTTIDVLRCDMPTPFDKLHGAAPHLEFAPSPGIEWTYINEDCVLQGGRWRLIPTDHSIAPFADY